MKKELNEKQIEFLLELKNSNNKIDNWAFRKLSESLKKEDYDISSLDEKTIELRQKQAEQERFCKINNIPLFAPKNGICFSCGKQIYNKLNLYECGNHITGCPYCCYSFVE